MHDGHTHHESDMKPAFMGLIVGAIALIIICFTIVTLTNNHFDSKKASATATH